MPVYLVDTTVFSHVMRRHPNVRAHLAVLGTADRLVICSIVRGEVLYGLERMPTGKRRSDLAAKAEELFAVIPCEPIPEAAADHYARIKRETERRGVPLDENDLWIAATALALGAVLATADSDFLRVTGVSAEDWSR